MVPELGYSIGIWGTVPELWYSTWIVVHYLAVWYPIGGSMVLNWGLQYQDWGMALGSGVLYPNWGYGARGYITPIGVMVPELRVWYLVGVRYQNWGTVPG